MHGITLKICQVLFPVECWYRNLLSILGPSKIVRTGMYDVTIVAGRKRMKRKIYGVCLKFRVKKQLHW